MAYASKTTVGIDRSKSEIEKTLGKYGASSFMYMTGAKGAAIAFTAHGRQVRMMVPISIRENFQFSRTPSGKERERSPSQQDDAFEQGARQRWRALALVVKAKLEAVESGVATFETEFLPYTLIPGTKHTAAEVLLPKIEEAYNTGKPPQLLLG